MATTLRFVLLGDDKASPAFERFARQVEQSNKAVGRNQAALKKQQDQQDSTSRSLAGLIGNVSGFGDVATAASGKSSIFARALAAVNVATGVAEPALAGVVVAAGAVAAAYASAAAGAIAYKVALTPLLAETKNVTDAQTKLDSARTAAQIAFRAALASGASQQTAAAARTKAMTAAQEKYNAAIKGTPAPVVALAKSLKTTQDAYKGWANSLARPVLAPLQKGLTLVKPLLHDLTPLVLAGAKAIGILAGQAAKSLSGGGLQKFIAQLVPHVVPAMVSLGHSIANIAVGIGGIIRAFLPMADTVGSGVEKLTAKFREWAVSLPSHTGFQSLMNTFRTETPLAVAVLKNLAEIIRNVAAATVGLASPANSKALLQILTPLSQVMVRLTANAGLVRTVIYLGLLRSSLGKLNAVFGTVNTGVGTLRSLVTTVQKLGIIARFTEGFNDARVAASAFSGTAGTLGGKLAALVARTGTAGAVIAGLAGPLALAASGITAMVVATIRFNQTHGFTAAMTAVNKLLAEMAVRIGFSVAGWQNLARVTAATADSNRRLVQALDQSAGGIDRSNIVAQAYILHVEQINRIHAAAAVAARNLSSQLGVLADAYGLTQAGAAQLAAKAGVTASALAAGGAAGQAAFRKIVAYAGGAGQATLQSIKLTTAQNALKLSLDKVTNGLLAGQSATLAYQQAQKSALQAINASSTGLRGQSSAALAARQAVLQATQAAIDLAAAESHQKNGMDKASQTIRDQIHWLQVHAGKSRFARDEIHALREEEAKLRDIHQKLLVTASGFWKVTGALPGGVPVTGGGPRGGAAQGMFVSRGRPGVDDQLIMAQRGELVVPAPMVKAGLADHLRGMIPGFAAGGVIGQHAGLAGMPKWLAAEDRATLHALSSATAKAAAAAMRAAQAAASSGGPGMPGPGGGAPAANAALARRLYPPWGSGAEWNAWNTLEMHEAGWNQYARNSSSGAYGIPQALPPSKMGAAANPPQSNPTAQIRWMIGYIKGRYGDPINAWAQYYNHPGGVGWYAKGGVVGGGKSKRHVSPQQQKWLNQLARDVKVLEAAQKHAAKRRRELNRGLAIDELWFLTHPGVKKGGIGWNEHEKALRRDRRLLRHFNNRENDRERELGKKIALLRLLTHYPRGKMYGGPGVPAPIDSGGGAGDGGGDLGGGDTGGGVTSAPSGPPPIPPPPMPAWMVTAGLGSGASAPSPFMFPSPVMAPRSFGGGMSLPDPIASRSFSGGRFMGGGGGGGFDLGAVIAAIQAMHQDMVGAVGRVAPGVSRGVDRSQNSMAARVAGRFS